MSGKAQAALENLMVYGWALAALVVVIAILVFFLGFAQNPADTCVGLPSKFSYKMHLYRADGNFTLSFYNHSGHDVNVTDLNVDGWSTTSQDKVASSGGLVTLVATGAPPGRLGEGYRVELDLVYYENGARKTASGIRCAGSYEPAHVVLPEMFPP